MRKYPQPELHFDDREMTTKLGSDNFIFVGSSCDAFAEAIPDRWIDQMLSCCRLYPNNKYLFQSKNPMRFALWLDLFPPLTLLGTTIESNFNLLGCSKTPIVFERYQAMAQIDKPKMISIEPIMDFDLETIVNWMQEIQPEFISIGADSSNNNLPEPSPDKIRALIEALQDITEVKVKDNLTRLMKEKVI